jgi:hypothetical protein
MQEGKVKQKKLIFITGDFLSALTAPVTVPEDGYFVLISPEQPGNVLLMGEYDE